MRIAIFTDAFLPQTNGVVTYVLDTASQLLKRGNQVLIFAPQPKRGVRLDVTKFPFKVVLLPSLPALLYPDFRLTIPALPKILLWLRQFKPDVVHIMDPLTVGTEGIMAAKIRKTPIVITFHTFFMDEDMLKYFRLEKRAKLLKTPLWRLTATYHNLADAVICPSLVSQKELEKHGLKKPTVIINNGIDLSEIERSKHPPSSGFAGLRRARRALYGIDADDKVGIYAGRLALDKSLDILISAWKIVTQQIPEVKLLIVGEGPQEKELKTLVDSLFLKDNVIFTGGMRREDLINKGIYHLADIFVTASKIENQSLAMLEAMAHGLPIVGVNARGTPELVDAKNGFVVEPDNIPALAQAIINLLSNPKLRKKLGRGSLQKVQDFDLAKSVGKLEATYRVLAHFKTL